ncbi:WD40 repeat-like protein [Wallemia mellicola CBS 633.66]|uniref:ASTRA-associated protein 1 n=1 Tax=Wallemia mellicola (strain ATCC MYA-4683 / CBS 633.66) TaxID=671144 RepID=I4YA55_WALMC|nr:WD40 repeat-like protein [Wallemia mellicola CBS 633.66]EIM20847.1 WD40 repeat-like protein [Wallemia mellicola CBS 633.66]|eukprot:XP_006959109.1 WD40 repeat-like protein [Wallemia mellicola CBS 633.66]
MGKRPPAPLYIIRSHESSISKVSFNRNSDCILSADDDGVVVITSTKTMRSSRRWKAHESAVLTLEITDDHLLTHGRDNLVKLWEIGDIHTEEDIIPNLIDRFHVNALNFCNVSLCVGPPTWLAAPHLTDSSTIDIWEIPSKERIFRSIGGEERGVDGRGESKTGLCMSLKLYRHADTHRLLAAYEDGSVVLYHLENMTWKELWRVKKHNEAVMGLCTTSDLRYAFTVSVDRCIVKYDLQEYESDETMIIDSSEKITEHTAKMPITKSYTTQSNGHSSISVRKDSKILAVGCWNGSVELYSAKSMKLVGVLDLHRQSVSSLAFSTVDEDTSETDEDNLNSVIEAPLSSLLLTGARDDRVAIYQIDL